MDKVFLVELGGAPGRYCELELPVSDYELLDALERLGMKSGDLPTWDILDCHENYSIIPLLSHSDSIYELNALSQQLAGMADWQRTAFEGLLAMELNKKDGDIGIERLRTLAANTDCCHVVAEAMNDSQLGRFYAENGLLPEVEQVPNEIFELLDFELLGRKSRKNESGVFIERGGDCPGGYVVQHSEMEHTATPCVLPQKPEYIFRLSVWDYFAEEQERKVVRLDLPATEKHLHRALVDGGIASWEEAVLEVEDSAIPGVLENMDSLYIDQMNELATEVKQIMEDGKLMLYKALLTEIDCDSISRATKLAGQLDDFILSPDIADPKDLAKTELRFLLSAPDAELVIQHVDLYRYGEALLEKRHSQLTGYGLLERRDGQPIQTSGVRNNDQTFHYERTKPLSQGMIMK